MFFPSDGSLISQLLERIIFNHTSPTFLSLSSISFTIMKEVFPSQKRKLSTLTSSVLSKKYILYVNSSRTSGHLTQKLGLKKQNHTGTGDAGKNAKRLSFNNASDWLKRLSPTATVPNFFVISAQGLKVNTLPVSCSGFDVGKSSSFLVNYYVSISYLYMGTGLTRLTTFPLNIFET